MSMARIVIFRICFMVFSLMLCSLLIAKKKEVQKHNKKDVDCSECRLNKTDQSGLNKALDWVPFSQLTDQQKKKEKPFSCGAYITPTAVSRLFQTGSSDTTVKIESDQSVYESLSLTTFIGDVRVHDKHRWISCDRASYDTRTQFIIINGHVVYRESAILMVGDKGAASTADPRMSMEQTQYVFHDSKLRGSASKLTRHENSTIDLVNAIITTCPPEDNSWSLGASLLRLKPSTGIGTARNVTLRLGKVPVFYSPFFRFPIDNRRYTGFLYPAFFQDSDNGESLYLPYYLNIAPNCDATIIPTLMSKRGLLINSEVRYLSQSSQGELGGGILTKDKLKFGNPHYDHKRWLLHWSHQWNLTDKWHSKINYDRAGDRDYLRDFSRISDVSDSDLLNQSVSTHYTSSNDVNSWNVMVSVNQYQNMNRRVSDPYNQVPHVKFQGEWQGGNGLTVRYLTDGSYFTRDNKWEFSAEKLDDRFDPDDEVLMSVFNSGTGLDNAKGVRSFSETELVYDKNSDFGYLKPFAKLQHLQYSLSNLKKAEVVQQLNTRYGHFSDNKYSNGPSTTVPVVGGELGLYFERELSGRQGMYRQSLEPRIKYVYSPFISGQEMQPIFDTTAIANSYQTLWNDSRFVGYDRLGDMNQFAVGLESKFFDNEGQEKLRLGIGQIIYLQTRRVYLDVLGNTEDINIPESRQRILDSLKGMVSPLITEIEYKPHPSIRMTQEFKWNFNANALDGYRFDVKYAPQDYRQVIRLGYWYKSLPRRNVLDFLGKPVLNPNGSGKRLLHANNISLGNIFVSWPFKKKWSGIASWQYDFTNKREVDVLSGVEYRGCCYNFRVFWKTWIRSSENRDHPMVRRGIFLQFVLTGLGGISSGSGGFKDDFLRKLPGGSREWQR